MADNEKKLPEMDQGFQKGSNTSEKSSPNGKSSILVEEIEKKAPSPIFPLTKPESHSPPFPKLISPGKNPFLSLNNREQVKPVYVFSSSS